MLFLMLCFMVRFYAMLLKPGLYPAIYGKGPMTKLEKKFTALTTKLGEINNIEHNKCSKIYPRNKVILVCIMPSIPLKQKCLSFILIWVIDSHKNS